MDGRTHWLGFAPSTEPPPICRASASLHTAYYGPSPGHQYQVTPRTGDLISTAVRELVVFPSRSSCKSVSLYSILVGFGTGRRRPFGPIGPYAIWSISHRSHTEKQNRKKREPF